MAFVNEPIQRAQRAGISQKRQFDGLRSVLLPGYKSANILDLHFDGVAAVNGSKLIANYNTVSRSHLGDVATWKDLGNPAASIILLK